MNIKKITTKIVVFYLIIPFIILLVLYPLLPFFLNYPPDSINSTLQLEIDSLTYTQQYILLCFIGLITSFILVFIYMDKIRVHLRIVEDSSMPKKRIENSINKLIKLCINTPLILYCFEILVPLIILPLSLVIIGADLVVVFKISMIIVLSLMLASVLCYTFSRKEFSNILVYIHELYPEKLATINDLNFDNLLTRLSSFKSTLLLEFIPLFLFCILFVALCLYNYNNKLIANTYNQAYSCLLNDNFSGKTYSSVSDALVELQDLTLFNNKHTKFFIFDENTYYTFDNTKLSDFLVKYTIRYSQNNKNRTYDYFCIDNFGSVYPININNSTYYVGVSYRTNSFSFLLVIVGIFSVLLLVMFAMIIYISTTTANKLNQISNSFKNLHDDSELNTQLAVSSVDEIGVLVSEFNVIQELNKNHVEEIKDNQDKLMEKERLASLGQLIGGIAHNLKTPIMSIAGAAEGLNDLIKEYDSSIGDPEVNDQDHHDIAKDMSVWVEKIRDYTEYMSDVITAVKGQAVVMSEQDSYTFTVDELVKRVDILMKHELKNALITLNTEVKTDGNLEIKGNVNSLVQVINNMISNAIQAYNGKSNENIELIVSKEINNVVIAIKDYAGGLPKEVSDKLFKEMITTKGKNGTGLGLFMSYSNIRAHFNGKITVDSKPGVGTEFKIILPL